MPQQTVSKMERVQTAVEWLVKELKLDGYDHTIIQAKQMEKEQLDKAYYQGQESKCIGGPLYTELYNK